jgi:hypothetical protein
MKTLAILTSALLLISTVSVAHEGEEGGAVAVHSVVPGSPAAAAGLQAGDLLLRMKGQELESYEVFKEKLAAHHPGDTVSLTVEREGEPVELSLTFGERPGGGVSVGLSLGISSRAAQDSPGEQMVSRAECLAWVDATYRVDSMLHDLGVGLLDTFDRVRTCMRKDLPRMPSSMPLGWCDNSFKIHCSGLDLLTEISEAQVERCEEVLEESLGIQTDQYTGWKTCGQDRVFERYSTAGEASDTDACRTTLLEECGTNIEAAVLADALSADQQTFLDCCSVGALDQTDSANSEQCRMIDDGFGRGPCLDRDVCVNRLTSEWIDCSVLD